MIRVWDDDLSVPAQVINQNSGREDVQSFLCQEKRKISNLGVICPATSCCPLFSCFYLHVIYTPFIISSKALPIRLMSCWGYFSSLFQNCRCFRFFPVSRFCRFSAVVMSAQAACYSWSFQLELCLDCGFSS